MREATCVNMGVTHAFIHIMSKMGRQLQRFTTESTYLDIYRHECVHARTADRALCARAVAMHLHVHSDM